MSPLQLGCVGGGCNAPWAKPGVCAPLSRSLDLCAENSLWVLASPNFQLIPNLSYTLDNLHNRWKLLWPCEEELYTASGTYMGVRWGAVSQARGSPWLLSSIQLISQSTGHTAAWGPSKTGVLKIAVPTPHGVQTGGMMWTELRVTLCVKSEQTGHKGFGQELQLCAGQSAREQKHGDPRSSS